MSEIPKRAKRAMTKRRVVQIATGSARVLYALADDGSVWRIEHDDSFVEEWGRVPNLPSLQATIRATDSPPLAPALALDPSRSTPEQAPNTVSDAPLRPLDEADTRNTH